MDPTMCSVRMQSNNYLLKVILFRLLFILVVIMIFNAKLTNCRVTIDADATSPGATDSAEFASHERLKRALKEDNLQGALKTFLEEWESHHSSSKSSSKSSIRLADLSVLGHHYLDGNSLVDHSLSSDYNPILADDKLSSGSQRSNCSSCMIREEARKRRLEDIKTVILAKLGLQRAPNVTHKPSLPSIPPLQHVLKQYTEEESRSSSWPGEERMSSDQAMPGSIEDYDGDSEDYLVDTSKAISFAQKPPDSWTFIRGIHSHFFKFSPNIVNSHVYSAHLWAYIKPTHHDRRDFSYLNATIVVYEVRRSRNRDSPTLLNVRSEKRMIDAAKGSWISLDIRKAVFEWFRNSGHEFSLVIHSYDNRGRELHVNGPYDGPDESQNSFVELSLKTKKSHRGKRETGLRCEENSNVVNCCLHPLTVDFGEFGWDWIIAPKRYEANFCSGDCPYMYLTENNHAQIVQQAAPQSSGPCCSPRKMSSLSMLYYDDNNQIIFGTLKGMIAERCGCS